MLCLFFCQYGLFCSNDLPLQSLRSMQGCSAGVFHLSFFLIFSQILAQILQSIYIMVFDVCGLFFIQRKASNYVFISLLIIKKVDKENIHLNVSSIK